MENDKLFSMDELLNLTYQAMMYGRRSNFIMNEAKQAHINWCESIFGGDHKSKFDICPSRDDAQKHILDQTGRCHFCYAKP